MNLNNLPQHHQYHITSGEQYLYDHLLHCVQTEHPQQVIGRFHRLFIQAKHYHDEKILDVLTQIVFSPMAEQYFSSILNRCCYILINSWQLQIKTHAFIIELIALFDLVPFNSSKTVKGKTYHSRLISLIGIFLKTEYYQQLKRLSIIVGNEQRRKINVRKKQETLGNLIIRYPYLYDHCLLSVDSGNEQKETVYQIKNNIERKFESELSRFVTYQIRLSQTKRKSLDTINSQEKIIRPVENPTLLSNRDLGKTLKHFVGPVHSGNSYQDLSSSFLNHSSDVRNYKLFKDDLYEYIKQSIDGKYGQHSFNKRLYEKMQNIYPHYHSRQPDQFLKIRTYNQLFNYLIVDSTQNRNHLVFMDMISNMGTTKTIGVLLKLVLLCSQVKPYIEKKFSILFNHYESFSQDGAGWLVRSLEKVHLAFTANFGKLDMSFLKRMYQRG